MVFKKVNHSRQCRADKVLDSEILVQLYKKKIEESQYTFLLLLQEV